MKEALEHWKEGASVLAYFGFLAFFTPKAEALGWGYKGILFCVLVGALLVSLVYLVVRCIAEYLADHREEVSSFREYMGIGAQSEQVRLSLIGTVDDHTVAELDAMLATNPYTSPEVFDDDKYTRLLPSVSAGDDTRVVDEADLDREVEEDVQAHSGKVAAIIGDNQRRRLRLAENFQPDANDPLATGVFLAGIPGSGKTVTLALFLEQYIKLFHLAVVIFDIAGDLRSIVEDGLCPRGLIATQDSMPSMAYVVQHRMQVIVDLQQCRRPGEAFINYELAAQLIAKTIKDIMNAQSAINPNDRLPCLIGLDETHIWAPQNPPSYLDPKTAKDLLDTLTVVATTGRKYGVVPFLAAQRIPKVHKDIIAGCETRILGKADLDNDIKRYREYVNLEVISDQGIRGLRKGRMVVCMNGKRLIVQFNQRESRHVSHTPGVTQALDHLVGNIPPELLASITCPVEVAHPTSTTQMENATRQPIQFPREVRRGHTVGLTRELRAALDTYRPGMTYRDLGKAMNCSDAEARIVFQELRRRGLLHATCSETEQETARPEVAPKPQKPSNTSDLERALQAYDQGNTTINALALALGMSPWNVRPLYTQVKKLREHAG